MRSYFVLIFAILILLAGAVRFILRGETHDRPHKLMSIAQFPTVDGLGHALALRFWAQLDEAESVELHTDAGVTSSVLIWEAFRNQSASIGLKNVDKMVITIDPVTPPKGKTQIVWKILPMTEEQLKKADEKSKLMALAEVKPDGIFYLYVHEDIPDQK